MRKIHYDKDRKRVSFDDKLTWVDFHGETDQYGAETYNWKAIGGELLGWCKIGETLDRKKHSCFFKVKEGVDIYHRGWKEKSEWDKIVVIECREVFKDLSSNSWVFKNDKW